MDRGSSSIWGTFISSASVLAASEDHASLLVLWDAAFSCKGRLFACQLQELEAAKSWKHRNKFLLSICCVPSTCFTVVSGLYFILIHFFCFWQPSPPTCILHRFVTLFRELHRKGSVAWWVTAPLESEVTRLKSQLYCFLHVWLSPSGSQFSHLQNGAKNSSYLR